jgi:energy-coupling factor transport system substrate-specific component
MPTRFTRCRYEALAREGARFVVAGGVASAANWLSRLGLSFVVPFPAALIVGAALGMALGFVLYRSWVFPHSSRPLPAQTGFFLLVNFVTACFVVTVSLVFAQLFAGLPISVLNQQNLAHAAAIACGALISFLGHRTFTFARGNDVPAAERVALAIAEHWKPGLLIVAVVLAHRTYMFWTLGPLIDQAAAANPGWLTWQYMPLQAYKDYPLQSLWYLQQAPPIQHIILAALIQIAEWPVGVARGLYALQAAVTIATAILMSRLLERLRCGTIVSVVVPLYFALSTDVVLIEINSFGQLIYETAGMLFATATCYCLCVALDLDDKPGELKLLALAGVLIALAALTRASLSYLFAPLFVFLVCTGRIRRSLVFLAPVLVLHGAWAFKNLYVYGYLSPATSSWAGMNATVRLADPLKTELLSIVASDSSPAPLWIKRLSREQGYISFGQVFPSEYLPADIRQRQDDINHRLGGNNSRENAVAVQLIAVEYWRAMKSLALGHIYELAVRFELAYKLYWQPPSVYSSLFVGPVFVEPHYHSPFSFRELWPSEQAGVITSRIGSGQRVDSGHPVSVSLPTAPMRALDVLCIWTLHIILPLIVLADLVLRWKACPPILDAKLLLLLLVSFYGAVLFNAFEHGENMRFRMAVTPINIVLCIGVWAAAFRFLREWRLLRTPRDSLT